MNTQASPAVPPTELPVQELAISSGDGALAPADPVEDPLHVQARAYLRAAKAESTLRAYRSD